MNYLEKLRELDRREKAAEYDGLADMIVAFVEKQDGNMWDSWSGTQRDYASVIMTDFAKFMGLELVIPEHKPVMTDAQVDKQKLLEEMRSEVDRMLRERINELIPGKPELL